VATACGNCGGALAALRLAGHYGQRVEIDLCAPCHGVWFDPVESARLSGPGLLALIGEMARAQSLAHHAARPDMQCPRCRGGLRQVHNRTRWGRSLQLECKAGHGTWQSFGEFLNEKGLLRPMSSADRQRALHRGALHCVNCGGAVAQTDTACTWCGSVPALVDVARLAHALDPEAATAGHRVHDTAARGGALQCAACGAAQPADGGWQCTACRATLAAPALAEAHQAVSALGPALAAHAQRPAPEVVHRRLAAQQPALDRQRERAAQMQAEADAVLDRHAVAADERALFSLVRWLWRDHPAAACGAAGLALLVWWLWGR
jgi:ribosomal protein S26